MVGAGPSGKTTKDWHEVWKNSDEAQEVQKELARIKDEMGKEKAEESAGSHSEFAMPFTAQLYEVTVRVFQQYWRTPGYIYSKILLGVASALFIGFSFFHANTSQQGIQDVIFSIFMITTIFTTLVQQIMPRFILQRDLYEVRERPSKAYSWKAVSNSKALIYPGNNPWIEALTHDAVLDCQYCRRNSLPDSSRSNGLRIVFLPDLYARWNPRF